MGHLLLQICGTGHLLRIAERNPLQIQQTGPTAG
jgi:hypothetical protein